MQSRMMAIAAALLSLMSGAAAARQAPAQPAQLVGVTVHAGSGESLGTVDRVIAGAGGAIAEVVLSVAGAPAGGHKLVGIPYGQLRSEIGPGPADVVAGFGVLGTAAPGVTGPFGTAHLASSAAATEVQPEGGPPGTRIVLPGATRDSLLAMPEFK